MLVRKHHFGQDIVSTGQIVKAGRQLVFGEVSRHSSTDKRVVCQGTSTYMVLPD